MAIACNVGTKNYPECAHGLNTSSGDRGRHRTKEDIFRSIADGFNRPKSGIETIVTIETRLGSHAFTNHRFC